MSDRYFWVKLRSGSWVVAERRHLDRWFFCGDGCIQNRVTLESYYSKKSSNDIVKIGKRIKRNT